MPKRQLTDKVMQSIKTEKVQEDVYDTVLPTFGVRVGRGGGRSFFVRYRGSGKNRRIVLGSYPQIGLAEARDKARAVLGEVARDLDPARAVAQDKEAITFGDLAAQYLERHAKRKKRTWKEDERILNRELFPSWKGIKAGDLRKADLLALLEGILERGSPIMANRVLALVRKVYNWGLGCDLVETTPCLGIHQPAAERKRERVLSETEIRSLWSEWESENPSIRLALQLLLLTGQRLSEVLRMRWQDVEDDLWTQPAAMNKAGRTHVVPLSRQALSLMAGLAREPGDAWVIPSPRLPGKPLFQDSLGHVSRRIQARVGFDWRVHDLRRTAATSLAKLGVDRLTLSRILNHADPSVTSIYDRYSYLAEKREALQRWADHLEALLSPKILTT